LHILMETIVITIIMLLFAAPNIMESASAERIIATGHQPQIAIDKKGDIQSI
jgi:Tfp pilus assembly protein FimT